METAIAAAATSPSVRECMLDMDVLLIGSLVSHPGFERQENSLSRSTAAVSRSRNGTPQSQNAPATTIMPATTASAAFHDRPAMAPRIGGEIASPRAWITRMLSANALARTVGCVTL